MPRYARAARFDYDSKRVSCTQCTRTETLNTIYQWFQEGILNAGETLPTQGNRQGRIFWLNGMAGTGKSTIAQTIANRFDETKELGASFFCTRDDAECSNVNLIFPTLAYQLSSFNPAFGEHVSEAMRKDPDVQHALTSRQLQKLIIDPLDALMQDKTVIFPPCIVVIDAL